jgi:DNA-binding MarR family transcriptional regulator
MRKSRLNRTKTGGTKRRSSGGTDKADAGSVAPRKSVDQILVQWQRERPDLDPAPMLLFGLLAQAHLLTTPYLNSILAEWDLSRGTFDVMSALRRSGPPYSLTPKQLSESLMLSGAGMTSRMDRLEAQHLIARLPEPSDRRSIKIQLTQRGVKLIDEIIPRVVAAQWAVAEALGLDQTNRLTELLGALTDTLSAKRTSTAAVAETGAAPD